MGVIYQPRGAALEYSPLACNLWLNCTHGCKYCFGPAILRKKPEEFYTESPERKDILHLLEKDCQKMKGDRRPILLSFVCDCYQPHDEKTAITRQALEILEKYEMNVRILTKGGMRAARDFDILKRNGWEFGSTVSFSAPGLLQDFEPVSAKIWSRIKAIYEAKSQGIYTWVSVEPVIDPYQALGIISCLKNSVDYWKIGKLNHGSKISYELGEIEKNIDWTKFVKDVRKALNGKQYYIKKDLLAWER